MSTLDNLTFIIRIAVTVLIALAGGICAAVYFSSKNKKNNPGQTETKKKTIDPNVAKDKIASFLPFDSIEDDMIVMDKGDKYVMLVEAEGINYHLMSDAEKDSVEAGFIQLLNSIRFPIQIYVQTTAVNLESSLDQYRDRLKAMEENLVNRAKNLQDLIKKGETPREELDLYQLEVRGLQNVYEYTSDLITNIESVTLNRWILKKHYYIAVPYNVVEMGIINKFSPQEMHEMARRELETRTQSVIQGLLSAGVEGKIVETDDLTQVIYSILNRDDANIYNYKKAKESEFDALFTTTPKAHADSLNNENKSVVNSDLFKFDY